jgi:hypothetical protein
VVGVLVWRHFWAKIAAMKIAVSGFPGVIGEICPSQCPFLTWRFPESFFNVGF